ncbi:HAD family acid phosphatase [Austwickia chelonae]|uniref:Acid phosphatase n=1 Tax=Austwickia chelonae NBRC 105200 TaxID=1184607 RepID=K6UMX8_9MICO|nr:HAD family acid phosphatase [Austwickia chelonae]GAB78506.1 hypothetical protein AUCHE_09_01110 [Austwickia chelonae NBRC 105200]
MLPLTALGTTVPLHAAVTDQRLDVSQQPSQQAPLHPGAAQHPTFQAPVQAPIPQQPVQQTPAQQTPVRPAPPQAPGQAPVRPGNGITAPVSQVRGTQEGRHTPAPAAEGSLGPQQRFTLPADGSAGKQPRGETLPNADVTKKTIRAYYGATDKGISDKKNSPYIQEVKQLLAKEAATLPARYKQAAAQGHKPAIFVDIDDTLLSTYDLVDAGTGFHYDPKTWDKGVQQADMPAVPGMVDFIAQARKAGFTVIGLTGRTDGQKAATLTNLAKAGYPGFTRDTLFTKWKGNAKPAYVSCAQAKCTTVEYKAGTRKHFESQGYRVALSIGDQWSDLQGGSADALIKLPNPTYYLPSADLPGMPQPNLRPRTNFVMRPDGSSGKVVGGEAIPNIDVVRKTIRTYYGADEKGIANPTTSPYRTEMAGLTAQWTQQITQACSSEKAQGRKPAVVLDTDDTTLMTYDMQDGAMRFTFDPKLQDKWVKQGRYPATPGMLDLVRKVKASGCEILGVTGRTNDQAAASVANLRKLGFPEFAPNAYMTKWNKGAAKPDYVKCAKDKCTTVEFKSSTRAWLESAAGGNYQIVANFGDQYSDLIGGHGMPIKLPNPTYYLP